MTVLELRGTDETSETCNMLMFYTRVDTHGGSLLGRNRECKQARQSPYDYSDSTFHINICFCLVQK
jgi:hypothetical protein